MKRPKNFNEQIKSIRKEALELGYSISTMDKYLSIWKKFITWKNELNFIYNEKDYSKFLLEFYHFDVNKYSNKCSSYHKQLMRSKRMLDDFDSYKIYISKRCLPNSLYSTYPSDWNIILDNYLDYCSNIRCNSSSTIKVKESYLVNLLSYFYKNGVNSIEKLDDKIITKFINETIDKGIVSKRRNFHVLKEFLEFLFIEDILKKDYKYLVPRVKQNITKKLPAYLKQDEVEKLLESIPRERKIDKRNYCIILIASRLGLRFNDIINIKLKDIDWKNNIIKVNQNKNHNLNILPLTKEVGWSIIDYIKNGRPICDNEYLFVKHQYPFEQLEQFTNFNKYFNKVDIKLEKQNKKGIHNLRNSLATNLMNSEIPIHIISKILGDSIEITEKAYLRVDKNNLEKCGLEWK